MGQIRFLFALWAAKMSIPVMKLTGHNATNYPGQIAINICPDFLKYIGKPEHIISVTGTNGKTTVNNMVVDIFEASGKKVLSNRAGSNTRTGITTALIKGAKLSGKPKYDTAVFETDERSSLRIFPWVKPEYILVTNLFRDSIMRNGHPEFIGGLLTKYIPKSSKLILNGDDLISCQIAPDNKRVYYGIDKLDSDLTECINLINDIRICPKCAGKLEYDYLRYHHIGKARCKDCGFASPEYDYTGSKIDYEKQLVTISDKNGSADYEFVNDSIFNIYNMVAITALFREMGYSHETISECMKKAKVVESRYKLVEENGVKIITQLAKEKNALAISRAFDYVKDLPGDKTVILMMNCLYDEQHWSENTCWMYDCDFEFLNNDSIKEIVVSGPRARDYRLRLLFAGVSDDKIKVMPDELEGAKAVSMKKGDTVCVFHGVDSFDITQDVRKVLVERAGKLEG
ncbi:MAG: MurT ligase domain-containing protein [Lachnospiraceae bacterium]|nr:MurT ligase domain-containing protein [Lachnospiraceae bacterium]